MAAAARDEAGAAMVDQALAAARLPDLPADCRRREASGIAVGDRLDVALLKSERALGRANARTARCAAFYDDLSGRGAE